MLAAPMTVNNLIIGEMLWAGSKGFFFSFIVLCILWAFGIIALPYSLLTPLVGFLTGVMFAALSLLVTSYVKTINHFNFYFTGLLSPMFFFSGVIFPIANLPAFIRPLAEIVPLTHSVRLVRAICSNNYRPILLYDLLYIAVFIIVVGFFAIKRLKKRLVNLEKTRSFFFTTNICWQVTELSVSNTGHLLMWPKQSRAPGPRRRSRSGKQFLCV